MGGATAAEFAMVVPVFFALIFGVIHLSFILWGETTALHWAAETAARCASIGVTTGPCAASSVVTASSVQAYALTEYKGPSVSAAFTADLAASAVEKR